MSIGFGSVRSEREFRYYFPNATHSSPADYIKAVPMDTNRMILIIAFSILLFIGILANGWVVRIVFTVLRQSITEASRAVQIFILALCACDVLVLAFLLLLLSDLWYGQWVVPSGFLCRCYLMSESLSKFYAPFLLVSLSAFCYFGVRRRRKFLVAFLNVTGERTTRAASVAVIVALVLSFTFMTPVYMHSDIYYLIMYNGTEVYSVLTKCAFQPPEHVMAVFTIYSFVCGYLVPAFLFTISYIALLLYVHNRRRKSSCASVKTMDYFSRIAKTSSGLVLFYLLSWTPYWIMSLYHYLLPSDQFNDMSDAGIVISYFIHMLPYINCNAYPLLYTVMNRSIQHDYLRACERSRSQRERRKISMMSCGSARSKSSIFRGRFLSRHNSIRSDPNSLQMAEGDRAVWRKKASSLGSSSVPLKRKYNRLNRQISSGQVNAQRMKVGERKIIPDASALTVSSEREKLLSLFTPSTE